MEKGILFKKPLIKDWLIWLWLLNLSIFWIAALARVISSGGPVFTLFDIVSGTIDAIFQLLVSLTPIAPLLIIRKVFWVVRGNSNSK